MALTTNRNAGFAPFGDHNGGRRTPGNRSEYGHYELTVHSESTPLPAGDDGDDQVSEAVQLDGSELDEIYGPVTGRIDSPTDVDMFRFDFEEIGNLGLAQTRPTMKARDNDPLGAGQTGRTHPTLEHRPQQTRHVGHCIANIMFVVR